jgi:hypothetical protein
MMTRRCAGRAGRTGAGSTWSPQADCLVSLGTCTASGNPRLRRERQACRGRTIGHPDRRRRRSSEKSPLSGAHGNGIRRSRIGHRWYSLRSVVPGPWKEGDDPNDLARRATRKALTGNLVFQNDETVAPAGRQRFFLPFNTVRAYDSNPAPLIVCGKHATNFCHSERSEESLFVFLDLNRREIPRFARNDKIDYFFHSLLRVFSSLPHLIRSGRMNERP